jgi:hypothetical protein
VHNRSEKITKPSVKTNHFLHLPYENLGFKISKHFKEWSHNHQARAEELIATADSVDDFIAILRDRKNAGKKTAICSTKKEADCCTYSAFIFDSKRKKAYYCQGNPAKHEFKKYGFS